MENWHLIKKNKKDLEIEFLEKLNQLESFLLEISDYPLYKDKQFKIYIDKVDDIWSNDEVSNNLVSGLLLGAYDIHSKFKKIKCVTFLRTDIYQLLDFHNKDHLRSEELEIAWTKESLKELIFKRVEKHILPEQIEDKIFAGKIDDKPLLDYMIERTLFRPRDLIQFCNEALYSAKNKKSERILEEHILIAEAKYSRWKIEDLVREYKSNYSFLNQILNYGKELGFNKTIITRKEFSENYETLNEGLEGKQSFFKKINYESLLDILYDINLIGVLRKDNISFKYNDIQSVNELDNEFHLHPAFWRYYGSQRKKEVNDVEIEIQQPIDVKPKKDDDPEKEKKKKPKPKKKSLVTKQKQAENIVEKQVGSEALKVNIEYEPLEEILITLESGFDSINELNENINIKPASFIRMTFTTKQAIELLRKLIVEEKKEKEFSWRGQIDKYEFAEVRKDNITNIFLALEKSIDPLHEFLRKNGEKLNRRIYLKLESILNQYSKGLKELYRIFIEEYGYDIFEIEKRMNMNK